MIPVTQSSSAAIRKILATMSEGKRGTRPVLKYSKRTGRPKIEAKIRNSRPTREKNAAGLYSSKRTAMVFKTLKPSL